MSNGTRALSLSRAQLARFIPDAESIKEFEKLFGQNTDIVVLVGNIVASTGLNADGGYPGRTGSNYLDLSSTMFQDSSILDEVMLELIVKVSISTILEPTQQTVLCDASLGDIDITLPDPSLCLNNNRSFRFAIHKIDSSINTVNILPNGSELVMNEASQSLLYEAEILNFITDGINWYLGA